MTQPWSKRELLAYLDRVEPALDRLNHLELLDVSATSGRGEIQASFHEMAARMHPDRHRLMLSAEDHERLTIVYARISEAYRVLRDDQERRRYLTNLAEDRGIRRGGGSEDADAKVAATNDDALSMLGAKAQRLYRRAQAALRTGDVASATLNIKMALARHPKSTFLRNALAEIETPSKK